MKKNEKYEVGFLGYGRMAQAISEGLDRQGRIPYARQAASDLPGGEWLEMAGERQFHPAPNNQVLAALCPVVIVAVKPQQVRAVLEEIRPAAPGRLFISIAAGLKTADLRAELPKTAGLVRVLPNLPALVGRGMSLMCAPPGTPRKHLDQARSIFEAVGEVEELEEDKFDAGTAVSGSGPAYFFLMMEAMIRGAVRLGLTWETARKLVLETALGSAEAARAKPDLNLAALRDQVTSPGGTTAEALQVMEMGGFSGLLAEALEAAAEKGRRLV
ncbi:MAG: pyrroline-5-carboxylate reductase [Candidatus Adiutrix sp.]|jgi:pyrroline-5-carboxylate reductase|nr:pyrroline-5-carboxylate reductase [Candidatus Adiutrix sp.]